MSISTFIKGEINRQLFRRFGDGDKIALELALRTRFEEFFSAGLSLISATVDTEVDGAWIAVPANSKQIVAVSIWEGVLAASETLTPTWNLQDATDSSGTGAADFGAAQTPGVVATGAGTFRGTTIVAFPTIVPAIRSHARMQHTLTTSAAGTVLGAGLLLFNDASNLGLSLGH